MRGRLFRLAPSLLFRCLDSLPVSFVEVSIDRALGSPSLERSSFFSYFLAPTCERIPKWPSLNYFYLRFLPKLDSTFDRFHALAILATCWLALGPNIVGTCEPATGERPKLTFSTLRLLTPRAAFFSTEIDDAAISRGERDCLLRARMLLVALAETWLLLRLRLPWLPSLRPRGRRPKRDSCAMWLAEA